MEKKEKKQVNAGAAQVAQVINPTNEALQLQKEIERKEQELQRCLDELNRKKELSEPLTRVSHIEAKIVIEALVRTVAAFLWVCLKNKDIDSVIRIATFFSKRVADAMVKVLVHSKKIRRICNERKAQKTSAICTPSTCQLLLE